MWLQNPELSAHTYGSTPIKLSTNTSIQTLVLGISSVLVCTVALSASMEPTLVYTLKSLLIHL